jgi:ubiquinol-cytochrome c reductase iron-sulfur subunit
MTPGAPPDEERRERAAARATGAAFAVSALAAAGFAATYLVGGQTQLEGATLGLAFAALATGLTIWARRLLPTGGYVEEREPFGSPPPERNLAVAALTEPGNPLRRRWPLRMLGLAAAAIAVAALLPLRSLLPVGSRQPVRELRRTPWRGGARLVSAQGKPVRPSDVTGDSVLTVFPEGHVGAGDAPAFVVRLDPARFSVPPPGGDLDGLVAYSLLCTHTGCPVRVYEQGAARVLCPCHQSTFDLLAAARPIAGPAARALPGLPLSIGPDGFVYATGDFTSPPGPGVWSRR